MALGEWTPFILLATRNGEGFLEAQLDSLLNQTVSDWRLVVRDDGSEDRTREIIDAYSAHDPRIERLPDGRGCARSAGANFAYLLQAAFDRGARYVFCCDQDDVWRPDKLARVLGQLSQCEGPDPVPCLVHHDLEVTNEKLRTTAPSYWKLMALAPGTEQAPQRLLSRNEVTGCALACNRSLLELALPIPEKAIMHDWWLALHAAFFGRLRAIPETLVQYRQHGANEIGAKSYRSGLNPFASPLANWRKGNDEFLATARQAAAFAAATENIPDLDRSLREAVRMYSRLPEVGRMARLRDLRKVSAWRQNPLLDLVLIIRMLALPRLSSE
jgi:glycosyltransferase involved in cell wall biosynthesis